MDIFIKAIVTALLGTIVLIGGGRAMLLTNDLRNYPNLRPNKGPANGIPGLADVTPNSQAAQAADPDKPRIMSQGEEEAAKSGFSTELENPNN